jgi:hypothetical protein
MNESQPDREHNAAAAKKYRLRRVEKLPEALHAVEADEEKARAEAAAEPSADPDPDDAPSDGRDVAGNVDQLAWLLAAADDEDFASRVFKDFQERLNELVCRIVVVLESGHLDAGRRQALFDRIAISGGHLVELADAVETDLGRCAR